MPVIRTLAGLGPARWLGIVRLVALAVLVEAGLKLIPLPRLANLMGVPLGLNQLHEQVDNIDDQLPLNKIERELLDSAWRILRHRPFKGTCLRRALIGGHVLRRHKPKLRIGVAKSAGQVKAHAWVELKGISLDPDAHLAYAVLQSPMADR
jgi:hypothetical protein